MGRGTARTLDVTRPWLVLRLAAPLMSFGGVAVDQVGPTWEGPGSSMLTGLLANALGWDWSDRSAHQALQDRLVHGAAALEAGEAVTDSQNAQLGKNDKGWTTRGAPEGRTGASYDAPHRRRRDFIADADILVVAHLCDGNGPTLDTLAAALERPARPLFLGRKPCLPACPLLQGQLEAATVHDALMAALGDRTPVWASWPEGEGPAGSRIEARADLRVWQSGLHGGSRRMVLHTGRMS